MYTSSSRSSTGKAFISGLARLLLAPVLPRSQLPLPHLQLGGGGPPQCATRAHRLNVLQDSGVQQGGTRAYGIFSRAGHAALMSNDRNVTAAYQAYRLAADQGVVGRQFHLLPGPSFLGKPLGYLPATTTHHTPTHVPCHTSSRHWTQHKLAHEVRRVHAVLDACQDLSPSTRTRTTWESSGAWWWGGGNVGDGEGAR